MQSPMLSGLVNYNLKSVWEPTANRGHMVRPLGEYFGAVYGTDLYDYGAGFDKLDFLSPESEKHNKEFDWIITNPPFTQAEAFSHRALELTKYGIAMFTRTAFLEGMGRHHRLFSQHPPFMIAQFSERVPIFAGKLDSKGSTAASYCWIIWTREWRGATKFKWIPPLRKSLEKPSDYPDNGE